MLNKTVEIIRAMVLLELPLEKEITEEDVCAAYRALSKIYHPDVAMDRYKDGEKFKELLAAKELLCERLYGANELIKTGFNAEGVLPNEPVMKKHYDNEAEKQEEKYKDNKANLIHIIKTSNDPGEVKSALMGLKTEPDYDIYAEVAELRIRELSDKIKKNEDVNRENDYQRIRIRLHLSSDAGILKEDLQALTEMGKYRDSSELRKYGEEKLKNLSSPYYVERDGEIREKLTLAYTVIKNVRDIHLLNLAGDTLGSYSYMGEFGELLKQCDEKIRSLGGYPNTYPILKKDPRPEKFRHEFRNDSELSMKGKKELYAAVTKALESASDIPSLLRVVEEIDKLGDYKKAHEMGTEALKRAYRIMKS